MVQYLNQTPDCCQKVNNLNQTSCGKAAGEGPGCWGLGKSKPGPPLGKFPISEHFMGQEWQAESEVNGERDWPEFLEHHRKTQTPGNEKKAASNSF